MGHAFKMSSQRAVKLHTVGMKSETTDIPYRIRRKGQGLTRLRPAAKNRIRMAENSIGFREDGPVASGRFMRLECSLISCS